MVAGIGRYDPDYAVPPGRVLEEYLEVRGLSQAEFARRCGRSAKLISEIAAGKAPVEPATARQFERVLGVDASVWLGLEANYRLRMARKTEAERAPAAWAKAFPVRELVKRGCFERPASDGDAVSKLLAFFGVGSVDAWTDCYGRARAAYRHSPSFESDEAALATWRRLGEIEAEGQHCVEYDKNRFQQAAHRIRGLTREPVEDALRQAAALCNEAGVAFALVPPLPGTALSGAAWWLTPRKAVIQLSARHKSDDHLWFSFFHEAAHILLHSKKAVFVDGTTGGADDLETEANEWASGILVPERAWRRLVTAPSFSAASVRAFADEQGIAPGIVVGMLQHRRLVPWSRLNELKVRLTWKAQA